MLSVFAAALAGFTLAAHTPRADYYTLDKKLRVDVKSCESFLAKTERILGVTMPRFEYYRVASESDVFRFSRDHHYAGGAANAGFPFVIATEPCLKHELVHLLTYQLGRAPSLFEEGVASFLADDYGLEARFEAKRSGRRLHLRYASVNRSFRDYRGSASDLHVQYVVSEEFVRHLVHERGLRALTAFFLTGQDATFRDAFGGTPQETFEEWLYGKKAAPK